MHLLCIYSNLTCINCVNICYCHLCVNSWGERTITYVMSLSIKILQWDFFLRSWQSLGTKLTVLWQTIRAVENGSKNCLQALVNSVRLWLEIEKRKMRWDLYSFLPGVIFWIVQRGEIQAESMWSYWVDWISKRIKQLKFSEKRTIEEEVTQRKSSRLHGAFLSLWWIVIYVCHEIGLRATINKL